jgi:hypothetical protein
MAPKYVSSPQTCFIIMGSPARRRQFRLSQRAKLAPGRMVSGFAGFSFPSVASAAIHHARR